METRFPEGQNYCTPSLSVLRPDMDFSRKRPGDPYAEIVVGDVNAQSVDAQLICGSAMPGKPKIMFSYILGGDVIFTQGRRQALPSLWQEPN